MTHHVVYRSPALVELQAEQAFLDEMSKAGWELVTVIKGVPGDPDGLAYYAKRRD